MSLGCYTFLHTVGLLSAPLARTCAVGTRMLGRRAAGAPPPRRTTAVAFGGQDADLVAGLFQAMSCGARDRAYAGIGADRI